MQRFTKAIVVNAAGLAGIVISLFIVPPKTPLWVWGAISSSILALLNGILVARSHESSSGNRRNKVSTVIIVIGFILLLLDLFFRYKGGWKM